MTQALDRSPRRSLRTLVREALTAGTVRAARDRRGMTLIEIMVVIAIIGILSTAIGFGVVNYMQKAKIDSAKAQLRTVANAVDLYAAENDYPSDLRALLDATPPLVKEKQLSDPWKQELVFNYPATRDADSAYDLCSKGPDKVEGNDDDVCND